MASGDTLMVLTPLHSTPTATLAATFDTRTDVSTPAGNFPVLDFDAATIEYTDFVGLVMPKNYDAGGITMTFIWAASTATTGVTRWGAAFRALEDDADDIDVSHTYDYNDVDATTASVSGEVDYTDLTFTDGADMDSVGENDAFVLRVRRNAAHGNDTMAGDAELVAIHVKET